jgi:AcrR family transcriptional regulator
MSARSESAVPATAPAATTGGDGRVLQARGRRTRRRLLEAAGEVFDRTGYHAARVDDVVTAAKSSHGTFYLYFASKEDLFAQLVGEVATELYGLIDELAPVTNSARGRAALRAWLARVSEVYARHGRVIRAWTESELSGDLGPARLGDDVLTGLALALTRRMRIPRRSGLHPTIATLALMMMVERLNYYAAGGQIGASDDELLDTLTDVIMAAVFG